MKPALLNRIDTAAPVLVALAIAGFSIVYVTSAYMGSSRIQNVIFIIPMAVLIVLLTLVLLSRSFRSRKNPLEVSEAPVAATPKEGTAPLGIAGMMFGLIVYAAVIPWLGFDVASILYMAGCLWVQGERRPIVVIAFSVLFSLAITWLLINGARIPAPTLFF